MELTDTLLSSLSELLDENEIGVTRLTPRPRGARLTDQAQQEIQRVLAALEAAPPAEASLLYANGCFAARRFADAAAVYQQILERRPAHPDAGFNLGLAYLRLKMLPEALGEFTKVTERQPSLAEAYYQRGNTYDDLGDHELASADYGRAVGLKPDYLQAIYNRGLVLAQLGHHDRAIEDFDRVIELRPDLSNAFLNRGASLDELGQHEQAIADYTAAVEFNPSNSSVFQPGEDPLLPGSPGESGIGLHECGQALARGCRGFQQPGTRPR